MPQITNTRLGKKVKANHFWFGKTHNWQRHNQYENRIISKCDVISKISMRVCRHAECLCMSYHSSKGKSKRYILCVAYYQWHRILWIFFAIKMLLNRNYVHSFQSIREIEHYLPFFLFIRFGSVFFLVCDKIERIWKISHKKLRWRNVCGVVYTTEKRMQPQTKNEILADSNMKMKNIEMNPFYRFWGTQKPRNPSDNHWFQNKQQSCQIISSNSLHTAFISIMN